MCVSQTWRLQAFRVRRGRETQMMTVMTTTTNNLLHSLLHPVPIHCPLFPPLPGWPDATAERQTDGQKTPSSDQFHHCLISCSATSILIGPHETINTYNTAGPQHAPSSFWTLKRQLLFADHLVSSSPDANKDGQPFTPSHCTKMKPKYLRCILLQQVHAQ